MNLQNLFNALLQPHFDLYRRVDDWPDLLESALTQLLFFFTLVFQSQLDYSMTWPTPLDLSVEHLEMPLIRA